MSSIGSTAQENLASNPSFEMLAPDGTPEDWDLFIMPMEGAMGRVSADAASGERSASLYTPELYETDPANNWSQVIYGEFGGKLITASAKIRTEEADGAAIWVQCFQRAPVAVLANASSGTVQALTGTNDWTDISVSVEAPQATSYVVLRCVIQGRGRVWFDDISLTAVPGASGFETTSSAPSSPEPEQFDLAAEFEGLRSQLNDSLEALQESSRTLGTEIAGLQEELAEIRSELNKNDPRQDVVAPASTETAEAPPDEMLQTVLEAQVANSEAISRQIDDLEGKLDSLESQIATTPSPSVVVNTPAPDPDETEPQIPAATPFAEQFEAMRSQIQATLDEIGDSNLELRTRLDSLQGQLGQIREELTAVEARREIVETQVQDQTAPRHILVPRERVEDP